MELYQTASIAWSSIDAEYQAFASTAIEHAWIQSILQELNWCPRHQVEAVNIVGTSYLCVNPIFHSHMKRIAIVGSIGKGPTESIM